MTLAMDSYGEFHLCQLYIQYIYMYIYIYIFNLDIVITNELYYKLDRNHMYSEHHYSNYVPTYRSNNTSDIYFRRSILECTIIHLYVFHI